jgi:hypothetical protein
MNAPPPPLEAPDDDEPPAPALWRVVRACRSAARSLQQTGLAAVRSSP